MRHAVLKRQCAKCGCCRQPRSAASVLALLATCALGQLQGMTVLIVCGTALLCTSPSCCVRRPPAVYVASLLYVGSFLLHAGWCVCVSTQKVHPCVCDWAAALSLRCHTCTEL
jgi:hypothetical protein